ncbi:MAG: HlyD family efflux transporter periplasmic adaptor subunit [Saprospiraceae bacterium]|nr:HlyD family efflux transporter periplasmic adaptor subunit [Saprospiraceae bacterium]
MPSQIQLAKPPEPIFNEREEIQYLLGNPPGWMLRFGLSSLAGIVVFLLGLSYFIRYPDVIESKIILTTVHPPIRVLATASGRVSALLSADHQLVEQGEVLAVLENAADWTDVRQLEAWLQHPLEPTPAGLRVGELQGPWSAFTQHWNEFRYYRSNNGTAERIAHLRRQILQLEAMEKVLLAQKNTQQAAFDLALKDRQRQQNLHANGIISDLEAEKAEAAFLQQQQQLEGAAAAFIQNRMQIRQIESQITDLGQNNNDQFNEKELTLAEDRQRLLSAVIEWKQRYLVQAPIRGRVSLSTVWSPQQPVAAGDEILAVVPLESDTNARRVIGKAMLLVANSGQVKAGMKGLIRLDGFPAQQFGALEATVSNIALVPQKDAYVLNLELPHALRTTYGKEVTLRQEMSGTVRIVTDDQRILSRIFNRLRDLLKNS